MKITHDELKAIATNLLDKAAAQLVKTGEFEGYAYFLLPNGLLTALPMTFSSDYEKQHFKAVVRKLARDNHALAGIVISEGWMSSQTEVKPSESPDRKEALLATCTMPGASTLFLRAFTRTEQGQIVFSEQEESDVHMEDFFGPVFNIKQYQH